MFRQSRFAAPQSGPAPNFVERRAIQDFVIGTNGICRHRYTDPAGRRAFHRGRDLPECRRCFAFGQGRYCRGDAQRALAGRRPANRHGDRVIVATATATACGDEANHGGQDRQVISSLGHCWWGPRVALQCWHMVSDIADNLSIVVHCNLISMTLHGFGPVDWTVAGALRAPADCGMQADIGRTAVQAVVFGDRDL